MLVESVSVESPDGVEEGAEEAAVGRAAHQAPETDGQVIFTSSEGLRPGRMVEAKVVGTEGVDLVAEFCGFTGDEPRSPGEEAAR